MTDGNVPVESASLVFFEKINGINLDRLDDLDGFGRYKRGSKVPGSDILLFRSRLPCPMKFTIVTSETDSAGVNFRPPTSLFRAKRSSIEPPCPLRLCSENF